MKPHSLIIVLFLLCFTILNSYCVYCYQDEKALVGKKAPLFEFKDLNGNEVSLDLLKGKIVVIDFWATWCGPCVRHISYVKEAYNCYKDNVVFIGISLDYDINRLKRFLSKNDIQWPQYFDGLRLDNKIAKLYKVLWIPQMFVVNKEGIIVECGSFYEIEEEITALTGKDYNIYNRLVKDVESGKSKDIENGPDVIKGKMYIFYKILILIAFICALGFVYAFLDNVGLFSFFKRGSDKIYVIENINFLENKVKEFEVQYKNWLEGNEYKSIDFIPSLVNKFKEKKINKYISNKIKNEVKRILELIEKFNQKDGALQIYKEKKTEILNIIQDISLYCKKLKDKLII